MPDTAPCTCLACLKQLAADAATVGEPESERGYLGNTFDATSLDVVVAVLEAAQALPKAIISTNSGPAAPTFDEHDEEVERARGQWHAVDGTAMQNLRDALARLPACTKPKSPEPKSAKADREWGRVMWEWRTAQMAEARVAIRERDCMACSAKAGTPCAGFEPDDWRNIHVGRMYGVGKTMTLRQYGATHGRARRVAAKAVELVACPVCEAIPGVGCPSEDTADPIPDTHAERTGKYAERETDEVARPGRG